MTKISESKSLKEEISLEFKVDKRYLHSWEPTKGPLKMIFGHGGKNNAQKLFFLEQNWFVFTEG